MDGTVSVRTFDAYPSFSDYMRATFGSKWCVAQRLTDRLRGKGYEVALTSKQYDATRRAWADGHPAMLLVETLPAGPERDFIRDAVRNRL